MKYHTWENIEDLASSGGHKALFPAYVVVLCYWTLKMREKVNSDVKLSSFYISPKHNDLCTHT